MGGMDSSLYNAIRNCIQWKIVRVNQGCNIVYDSMGWYENLQRYRYKAFGASIPSSFSSFYGIVRLMFHVEHSRSFNINEFNKKERGYIL